MFWCYDINNPKYFNRFLFCQQIGRFQSSPFKLLSKRRKLARLLGVSVHVIKLWELGFHIPPTLEMVEQIATFFDLKADDFLLCVEEL